MEWGSAIGAAVGVQAPIVLPKFEVSWTNAWLHASCVSTTDQTPEGGSLTTDPDDPPRSWRAGPNAVAPSDWRLAPRPPPGIPASFGVMNKRGGSTGFCDDNIWATRTQGGGGKEARWASSKHKRQDGDACMGNNMKYCPGDHCRVWLPLHQFANNGNMWDGMDMYCIECNNRRRKEQGERRARFVGKGMKGVAMDSFEQFCFAEDTTAVSDSPDKSEILAVIDQAILDARIHKGLTVPVGATVIYAKLFDGRRLQCEVTGRPMTPYCFLEHHEINFRQKGKRLDINCTNCKLPDQS